MISACMTVSVRELRTAVREWACWTLFLMGSGFSDHVRKLGSIC